MELKRTANAGVLLQLDGVRILLDGVCSEVKPYCATPSALRDTLLQDPPDAVAFTHTHPDHYDRLFVCEYSQKSAGPVLGPADVPNGTNEPVSIGSVRIIPVQSRHLGKTEPIEHLSYILQGSRTVWFMGDAACDGWLDRSDLPKPDVLIAPYSFAMGRGWEITKALKPHLVVLLHLPERRSDPYGLWESVEKTLAGAAQPAVLTPDMAQSVYLR